METKIIITGNGYTALVPNGSFPPPAQVCDQPSVAEHLLPGKAVARGCAREGDDGEINTNMNQLWSLQTPRTFTDKHTHLLPCWRDREGYGQSCSPWALRGVPEASLPFGITIIITGFIFTSSYLLSAKIW